MAIVNEEILKRNMPKATEIPVYLFFGEEGYLKQNYTEKIAKQIADEDDAFNYSRFNFQVDLQDVYDAVMQFPFGNDKKFVMLCDYDFEGCSKSEFEKLILLITEVPDTTVFVIRFDSFLFDYKKSKKFAQIVSAVEKVGGLAVNFSRRNANELVKMLKNGALKRGCNFESGAAEYLVSMAGEDILILSNELQKLCAFIGKGAISKQTVDDVCVKTVEANVFSLSNFIFNNQMDKALLLLDDLFFMKIAPAIIFQSISSAYVDMLRVYYAKKEDLPISEVKEIFKYASKGFLVDKAAENVKRFDFNKLSISMEALIEAEKKLKSSGVDEKTVLEQLIVKLIYISVKGEAVDKT